MKDLSIKLNRTIKVSIIIPAVFLAVFVLSGCSQKEINLSEMQSKVSEQQAQIDELQKYKDEQARLEEEKKNWDEEENKRENEARILSEIKDKKELCENRKKDCLEDISLGEQRVAKAKKDYNKSKDGLEELKKEAEENNWGKNSRYTDFKDNVEFHKKQLNNQEDALSETIKNCAGYKNPCE